MSTGCGACLGCYGAGCPACCVSCFAACSDPTGAPQSHCSPGSRCAPHSTFGTSTQHIPAGKYSPLPVLQALPAYSPAMFVVLYAISTGTTRPAPLEYSTPHFSSRKYSTPPCPVKHLQRGSLPHAGPSPAFSHLVPEIALLPKSAPPSLPLPAPPQTDISRAKTAPPRKGLSAVFLEQ